MRRGSQTESGICPLCGNKHTKHPIYSASVANIKSILICRKCNLFFCHPKPDEADLAELYKFHYQVSNIETEQTHMSSPSTVLGQILEFLEVQFGSLRGRSLLDYGCGVGAFAEMAKQKGMNVAGIEVNDSARQCTKERGITRIYGSMDELKKAEVAPRFDFITLIEVIEHLHEPWNDLGSLLDLLSENGYVFITTPNVNGLNARFSRGQWREFLKPTHLYWFGYNSLKLACNRAGLMEVHRVRHRFSFPVPGTFHRAVHILLQCFGLDGGLRVIAKR